jgi:hypothetical protein
MDVVGATKMHTHSPMNRRLLPRAAALRHFTVLALESSADDTCAAVVTSSRKILSNVVLKQNHV